MRKIKRNNLNKNKKKSKAGYFHHQFAKAQDLLQTGRLRDAEFVCKEILGKDPRHIGALSILSSIALAIGDNKATLGFCRRVVSIDPSVENIHINMGIASYNLQDYNGAVDHYLNALNINNNNALTYFNLGNAFKIIENYPSAIEAYEAAIELKPDYFKAYCNVGSVYSVYGFPIKAEQSFKKAIELNPSSVGVYNALGFEYLIRGDSESAEASFNNALELHPGNYVSLLGLANIAENMKDFATAYEIVLPLVKKSNKARVEAAVVVRYSSICSRMGKSREAFERLSEVFAEITTYSVAERRTLYFEIARLYDEFEMFDEAFEHYLQGNMLKKVRLITEEYFKKIRSIIDTYSSDKVTGTSTVLSRLPVFIVGMPRSGTSLVEQILASHPKVYGAGELNDISQIIDHLPELLATNKLYPECEKDINIEQLDMLARKHLEMLAKKGDSDEVIRVIDKMPFNFRYLGFIKRLFPHAIIIHCTRDPMDNCLSCYFQDFSRLVPFAYDLKTLGIVYRQYEHLMMFWRDEIQISMLEVRYEELVNNQEKVSRELIEHCGLDWDDRCLEFYKSKRVVNTASMHQVNKPIYTKSAGRWKNYEKYLAPLKEGLDKPVHADFLKIDP